jgi:hypothetical protein
MSDFIFKRLVVLGLKYIFLKLKAPDNQNLNIPTWIWERNVQAYLETQGPSEKQNGPRKYKYRVLYNLTLPPPEKMTGIAPIMSREDVEWALNQLDEEGWEFVGMGRKEWRADDHAAQNWWIFRRQRV